MTFRSYAQNFEDVILWRALKDVDKGFYIDIGANDPVIDSVSLAFYERGWRGIHVEPLRALAEKLRVARPDEKVIEAAVADKAGEITLFDIEGGGLTTGNEEHARRHAEVGFESKKITVKARTLASILPDANDREIQWMKIDVEGMEGEVLASWGREKARPWILVIESTLPNTQIEDFERWEPEVLDRGYKFVYYDGLNRFYAHEDHRDLCPTFGPGPNCFDCFTLTEHSLFVGDLNERHSLFVGDLNERMARALANEATLRHLNRALEEQLHEVRHSTSWRMTAPLRHLKKFGQWWSTP